MPSPNPDSASTVAFIVRRDNLLEFKIIPLEARELEDGEVELSVDRFAFTSNNVTYGAMGEAFSYWNFFPTGLDGWGTIPVWGYGTVVRSKHPEVEAGERFFGYYPMATRLIVRPTAVNAVGFSDGAAHRQPMNGIYNRYQRTTADPGYRPEDEPFVLLYRPLFGTAFFIDDLLAESGFFGAKSVIFSSASSKTSYCAAFLLSERQRAGIDIDAVGLTSPANLAFVKKLGVYDRVVSYDDIAQAAAATSGVFRHGRQRDGSQRGSPSLRRCAHPQLHRRQNSLERDTERLRRKPSRSPAHAVLRAHLDSKANEGARSEHRPGADRAGVAIAPEGAQGSRERLARNRGRLRSGGGRKDVSRCPRGTPSARPGPRAVAARFREHEMITFYGMGLLGSNFVRALLRRKQPVRVWNRTPGKATALVAEGAIAVTDPAEAARGAERLHLTLSDDAAVDDVLERARPGISPNAVIVDHTTTSPAGARARAARWAERGIAFQHAPVFMGPQNALEATGIMLASGDKARFDALSPELSKMTGKLVYLGAEPERAAGFKLLGNEFLMFMTAGLADFFMLARGLGISPNDAASLLKIFNPAVTLPWRIERILAANYSEPSWELAMARKDARLMIEAAAAGGVDLAVLPAIAQLMDRWLEKGHAHDDWTVIASDAVKS